MATKPTTTAPTMPAAEQTTTISGYAIQILAFIPIGKKDLKRQAEIPILLMDLQEGRKTIADLAPFLHAPEVRQSFLNKRFPISEAKVMLEPKSETSTTDEPTTDAEE